MQWTDRMRQVKFLLVCAAVIICAASLTWTHYLVADLSLEERERMEVWAEAMRTFDMADDQTDLSLVLKVINGNNTIPVIVLDEEGEVQTYRNLAVRAKSPEDVDRIVREKALAMKEQGRSIRIELDHGIVAVQTLHLFGVNTVHADVAAVVVQDEVGLLCL